MFDTITGIILAGGRSSRFGENKAFALFQRTPLIERVLDIMKGLFQEIFIVTNTPEEYAGLWVNHPSAAVVNDHEPYQGPLGGLFTGLRYASHSRVFVVACDMPLLDPSVITRIIAADDDADAVIPIHPMGQEYLMALYSRRVLPDLCHRLGESPLGEGRFSMREFCSQLKNVRWVPIEATSATNINTKEELKRMEVS